MRATRSRVWLAILLSAAAAGALGAQSPAALADSAAYARYRTPGQCRQAAIRLYQRYWRARRADTVVYAPATDSVPASVVRSARACAARFSPATAADRELFDLSQLYLWTQQPELRDPAIARLLATPAARSDSARAWMLAQLVDGFLRARPARIERARALLAQLDGMSNAAGFYQLLAHLRLAQYALTVNDVAAAESHARAGVAASRGMSHGDRQDWMPLTIAAYGALGVSLMANGSASRALALWDSAGAELPPLLSQTMAAFVQARLNNERAPYMLLGTAAKPIHGDRWYNVGDTASRPRLGRVTLVVFGNHLCGGLCYPAYATIRRLHDTFGPDLDVVVMAGTVGFFRNHVIQEPAAEADSASRYYLDFLKLPVVLAVSETVFSRKADGRRVDGAGVNLQNYGRGLDGVVVGRNGTIRLLADVTPQNERLLRAVIAAEMQIPRRR